jgi:small subunit ribosomal protein S16
MVRIRLTRRGKRNQPTFRIVAAESSRPIKGKFLEILGHFNPRSKELVLKKDRILEWLKNGAQPSKTVHNLLVDNKIIDAPKVKATRTRTKKGEGEEKKSDSEKLKEEKKIEEKKEGAKVEDKKEDEARGEKKEK